MKPKVVVDKALAMAITFALLVSGFLIPISTLVPNVKSDSPWSSNVEVSNDPGTFVQNDPSIVVNSTGAIFVVWEDDRLGDFDLFIANSTDGGLTWSNPDIKIEATTDNQVNPSMVVDANGTLYVIWQDLRAGLWDIYFANSTDGGFTWSQPNEKINTDISTSSQSAPSLAIGSDGTLYAVWEDMRSTDWDIYFAKSTDKGATWTHPNVKVSSDTLNSSQRYPAVAVDESGGLYVAWQDDRNGLFTDDDIYFANSTDGGLTWTDPDVRVNNDATILDQRNPSIAVNESGTVYLVWQDYRNTSKGADIYFSSTNDGGATWLLSNEIVNTDLLDHHQTYPAVTSAFGNIYTVWEDFRQGNADIFFAESADGGLTWTHPNNRVVDDVGSSNQFKPAVAVTPNSTVCVAWEDYRSGDNYDIYFANLTPPPPPPTPDYIQIRTQDNGMGINLCDPGNYPVYLMGEFDTFYGAAYNDSAGYIGPVPVTATWVSNDTNIVTVTSPGLSSTITCNDTNFGWVWVTLDDGMGNANQTMVTVLEVTIDYILIRDASGGGGLNLSDPANYTSFPVGKIVTFYGAAYNNTYGFVTDVDIGSTWISSDSTIVDVSSPGFSSTVICNSTNWGTVTITLDDGLGHTDTTNVTVLEPTIDDIQIRDAALGGGNIVTTGTYSGDEVDEFYAAAINGTAGYLWDVEVVWDSDDPGVGTVTTPGLWTNFTAQHVAADSTCTVTATYGLISNSTGLLTVLGPVVDYILIRDAANNAGSVVDTATYWMSEIDVFYAAAYNNTINYIYDVEVVWSSDNTSCGQVTTPGIWTNFTAQQVAADETCTVTATYGTISDSTGLLTVLAPRVDYIQIRDALGGLGSIIDTATYSVLEVDEFYAAAYNETADYLFDVEAAWLSDDTSLGQVTTPGLWTNFSAQQAAADGTCTVTATYQGAISNSTGLLTVLAPRVDHIQIRDAPDGGGLVLSDPVNYPVFPLDHTVTFYGARYNGTIGFIGAVPATSTWGSNDTSVVDINPTSGNQTDATSSAVNSGLVLITLDDVDAGISNTTQITVLDINVDYIRIRDADQGAGVNLSDPANYPSYPVGFETTFYAAAYNHSFGYITDIPVTWSVTDDTIVAVTLSGYLSDIVCSDTNSGTVTITADDGQGHTNTTQVTVLFPEIDFIQIRDAPANSGDIVTTGTYLVADVDNFYAAGHNHTAGFVRDVEVTWSSDDMNVGQVTTLGIWTNFSVRQVPNDTTCTVTATLGSISNSTGLLQVLAPRIDEIIIRDAANEGGNILLTSSFEIDGTDEYFAAGYNDTIGYVTDLAGAQWNVTGGIGGATTPGASTIFTATADGTGTLEVSYTYDSVTISNSSGVITVVIPEDTTPPSAPGLPTLTVSGEDSITITWPANTEVDLAGYRVYRRTSPDDSWVMITQTGAGVTSYNDEALEPDTQYYYSISAIDNATTPNESPLSTYASAITEPEVSQPIDDEDEFPWMIILIVIIVVVILMLVLILSRKKSSGKELPPEEPASQQTEPQPASEIEEGEGELEENGDEGEPEERQVDEYEEEPTEEIENNELPPPP